MDFITLKNITKTFDGVDVLKDINLKIIEGETLGILGRSGSGKSVLIPHPMLVKNVAVAEHMKLRK